MLVFYTVYSSLKILFLSDDCWAEQNRDAKVFMPFVSLFVMLSFIHAHYEIIYEIMQGNLAPNSSRFPSGIKALADYVHGKGLRLGVYSDAG